MAPHTIKHKDFSRSCWSLGWGSRGQNRSQKTQNQPQKRSEWDPWKGQTGLSGENGKRLHHTGRKRHPDPRAIRQVGMVWVRKSRMPASQSVPSHPDRYIFVVLAVWIFCLMFYDRADLLACGFSKRWQEIRQGAADRGQYLIPQVSKGKEISCMTPLRDNTGIPSPIYSRA